VPILGRVRKYHPICGVALILCAVNRSPGQDAIPAFEVATIRPNVSGGPQRFNLFPEFTAQNATLKDLLTLAYDVKPFQVSGGPGWIDSERYDISAKLAGTPTPGREAMMIQRRRLQSLLEDRFKLAVHREMRELPIYQLILAKGGPKLQAPACVEMDPKNPGLAPGKTMMDYCGSSGFFKGRFEASAANMEDLTKAFGNLLGRTVVDKTGIHGMFHITLMFAADDGTVRAPGAPGPPADAGDSAAPDPGPNIFTAIQEQLGLKLESSRGPVEVMVIDHAEKPSAN
jgi:uncharacterized protein (TIGR03435 family)